MLSIQNLTTYQGSWVIGAIFDDAIRRYLQNQPYDLELIRQVVSLTEGQYCQRYAQKLHQLTGAAFSLKDDTSSASVKAIINIDGLANTHNSLERVQTWRDHLEQHIMPKVWHF